MYAIGIDIGGMSIKAGLVLDGKIVDFNRKTTVPTSDLAIKGIVEQINELLVKNSLSVKDIKGIGMGAPGLVSSESGVVEYCPNINWNKVPVVDILRKKFDTYIKVSNDANVAALGEAKFGAGAKFKNSIMLTLGTGVGSGIIIDGNLFEGGFSKGSELGHMVIKIGGEKCGCGRRGCFESYASATALIRMTKKAMLEDEKSAMWQFVGGDIDKVDGRTSFECAKSGDNAANKVVDEYVMYLSEGIMNLANIFRPDAFILGGGVSAQGEYLTNRITAYCEKYEFGYKYAPRSEIVVATLGNDAGIIGAAALVL